MASSADIKKRIKSVANTKQITKAMEVVSATKMRRAQELALKARPYAFASFELLAAASKKTKEGEQLPVLLTGNKSKKTLAVVVASDKGLAGSLNANVLRRAVAELSLLSSVIASTRSNPRVETGVDRRGVPRDDNQIDLVTVGKKAKEYFAYRGYKIVKEFIGHGDYVDIAEMNELHEYLLKTYSDGIYGKVVFVYTNFLSTLRQEAVSRQVLPITKKNLDAFIEGLVPERGRYSDSTTNYKLQTTNYLFEPTRERVIKELADRLFKMTLYHIQLESNASEHSARMVAMKTASENAEEIVDDLTLVYNKGRQAKITQEIVEITSGSDAVA